VEGELLWPQRFSQVALDGLKRDLGSTGYAAQYQQTPVPAGGGLFKQQWFRYFNETSDAYILHGTTGAKSVLKSHCRTFGTLDLAISSKQNADYTVFAVWCVTPEHDLLLRHVARAHLDNAAQLRQLQSLHSRFRPDYWKVETVAYQLAFFQQAVQQGLPCREFRPVRDKVSRAATASVWSENGKTYFLSGASWLPEWESEHLSFPKGAHDDQVDNHSMAAEDVVTPSGPVMWSPDSGYETPYPVAQAAQAHRTQVESNMVQVDWGKGGKDGIDLAWDFDEGDMHDLEMGGRW
jgi:predicted phage terminase large subunit-like protein